MTGSLKKRQKAAENAILRRK